MNILFIHQNFPGQFLHLSADLASRPGNRVVALGMAGHAAPPGVELRRYRLLRAAATDTHPLLADQESQVRRAEACAAAALQLRREGFEPDVILAHPGWGEALFMRDVFPRARLLVYCEYYYAADGQDVGFDPAQPPLTFTQRCQLRLKNTVNLLSMEAADAAISPTEWQKNTYPAWARDKITVIHDGIDGPRLRFDPAARLSLQRPGQQAVELRPGDEVITYVARHLEPMRGFQMFMRTLPAVLRRRPSARAIIVGREEAGYGPGAPSGATWKQALLDEIGDGVDLQRIHFTGQLPYADYARLLSISRIHAYWTAPFVLSWSFLEAAASGVPMVASATPPVLEFSSRLGIDTRDFFDLAGFEDAIVDQCMRPYAPERPARLPPELQLAGCLTRQRQWLGTA